MKGLPKDSKKLILRASLISFGILGFIIMILNVNAPTSVTAQTFQTPNGPQTTIISSCVSTPNIPGNTLCNLSNNVSNKTIPILDGNCGNGGISVNNICPTSVVPLSAKPVTVQTSTPIRSPDPIKIIPVVSVIDDSGNINPINTSSVSLFLNSLTGSRKLDFIATTDNVLIDKGQIKLQIQLQGRSNSTLTANGTLWIYVNGISVNPSGVRFAINNVAGQNGLFVANLDSPTGSMPGYTFDIQTNLSMLSKTVNILSFNMSNISIQNEKGQKFTSSQQQKFFSIEIDNMPNLIIQKNAQGQSVRVYPSDDTFTLLSSGTAHSYNTVPTPKCGCGSHTVTITAAPLPTGDADVYQIKSDGSKLLLGHISSVQGSGGSFSHLATYGCSEIGNSCASSPTGIISGIPRDIDISVVISGGANPSSKMYHTPVTQQAYSFTCTDISCGFSP